jgi:hypothetical protein
MDAAECLELPQEQTSPSAAPMSLHDPNRTLQELAPLDLSAATDDLQSSSPRSYRRLGLASLGADAAGGTSDLPSPRMGITASAASTPDLNR